MRRVFSIFALVTVLSCAAEAAPVSIVVGKSADGLEALAARELRTYLYAATGSLPTVANGAGGDAIAVGTPDSNALVRKLRPDLSGLGDEGYLLKTVRDGKRRVLMVTGNTPAAVLHGAYGLLEQYGFGFYLGGDAIPAKRPLKLLDLSVRRKPAFAIRGTLPWYNFFDSPTAWDFEDYAFFFDQLAKTGNNFVGFHSYDHEPFAAYREPAALPSSPASSGRGEPAKARFMQGEPVQSTANSCWGTVPMKTSEFGGNTSRYFATEYFGSKPSLYRDQRDKSIAESQAVLAKALDYGKSRGIKVCVGFEVTGKDPTDPAEIARLEKRLRGLVTAYPMLDYVWIWESESKAVTPDAPPALDSDFGAYCRRYAGHFAYLNDPARSAEATRLAIYAIEARRILSEIAPRVRLVLSGWGGDSWLKVSDFYPGLDKALPRDVIFAALDNIAVTDTVSGAYGKLSPERERWPIPWFEYDGDQWFPQANAKAFGNSVRDALAKGSQGILGIHWRTRDVEESHAYMSQLAWDPKLTFEQFYADYARKQFGPKYAKEMAAVLMEMQSLGYRLVGGRGQVECGSFTWGSPTDPTKIEAVTRLLGKLRYIETDMLTRPGREREAERVAYLAVTCEWALRYEKTASLLRDDGEVAKLLREAKAAQAAGDSAKTAKLANDACSRLGNADFVDALQACAQRVTNKGELGSLATVNAKAWAAYRTVAIELHELAGRAPLPEYPFLGSEKPMLSPIGPNTLWSAGGRLPIRAVAHLDECEVRVVWRVPAGPGSGFGTGVSRNIKRMARRYFEGSISCPQNAGILEYALELTRGGKLIERWPGKGLWHQVTLVPPLKRTKAESFPVLGPPAIMSEIKIEQGDVGALVISWQGGAGRYEIKRSVEGGPFEPLRTISDTWFEDRTVEPARGYRYSVTPLGTHQPGTPVMSNTAAPGPMPAIPAPVLTASPRRGKVRLEWGPAPLGVTGYVVIGSDRPEGPWSAVNKQQGVIPAVNSGRQFYLVPAEPGKPRFYAVQPIGRGGGALDAVSNRVECRGLPMDPPKPVVTMDFSGGDARFIDGRSVSLPHKPEFDTGAELTISLCVKLERAGQMPVLVSHGVYASDGYFLQVLGGLRFYLHGVGCLDAGSLPVGKWRHIVATYDGASMRLYIDGGLVGEKQAQGQIAPCARSLYIGRYEIDGPEYRTDCLISVFRLYATGLTDDEVKQEYTTLKEGMK